MKHIDIKTYPANADIFVTNDINDHDHMTILYTGDDLACYDSEEEAMKDFEENIIDHFGEVDETSLQLVLSALRMRITNKF